MHVYTRTKCFLQISGMDVSRHLLLVICIVLAIFIVVILDESLEGLHLQSQQKQIPLLNNKAVNEGYSFASTKSITICCLARDCYTSITINKQPIKRIGKCFAKYKVVVFENDSRDGTRECIKDWCKEDENVHLLNCPEHCECQLNTVPGYTMGQFSKARISKMGNYRQRYVDYVDNHRTDFTLVVDIDLDLAAVPIDGLMYSLHHMNKQSECDAFFINARSNVPGTFGLVTVPYDALAFERVNYRDEGLPIIVDVLLKYVFMYHTFAQPQPLVRVDSAFNGIALYKTDSFVRCSYTNDGSPKCEHCVLHAGMKNKFAATQWITYQSRQGDGSVLKQIWNTFVPR